MMDWIRRPRVTEGEKWSNASMACQVGSTELALYDEVVQRRIGTGDDNKNEEERIKPHKS